MIVVIDNNSQFHGQVNSLYQDSDENIISISDISRLDEVVEGHGSDVILIGPSVPTKTAIEEAARLSVSHPEISVVMAVETLDPGVLREAMRAGVKDVLEQGSSNEQIISSISRASEISRRLKDSLDLREEETYEEQPQELGKVITFFSTKGGVGKSVISTNSAVALAKITGKRVVVLDLDLQFGDVAIMFQMAPNHTIYDVVQVIDRLDGDMLQGFLTTHSSGIKALLAPVRPHESDSIASVHVKAIIDLLKKVFDYVVIDTPPVFSDVILTALDESDRVYLIATMDMPSIKNIKLAIQTMKQLGYSTDIIKFVLNRADSKVWLEIDEVEKTLGIKADAKIPSDRIVPRSVNKGMPVVIEQPKSSIAKSIFGLAEKIKDAEIKPASQPGESRNGREASNLIRRLA
ncbi:MAG: AAA family ATPase [Actinobacteria bacterium]|nr:AAA family ATPase [Actinomycetota bacterium]